MKTLFFNLFIAGLFFAFGKSNISTNNSETPNTFRIINQDTIINFENDVENNVPKGFAMTNKGKGQTNDWKIINDQGNKVSAQLAKNQGSYFNLLVLDKIVFGNFKMSVRIKAVTGDEDQGGGLVWRYIDNNNYYIARYNSLENNFRFYKVVNGNRKELESIDYDIKSGEWFTMTIEMIGNEVTCLLNNIKLIESKDDTFTKPGLVGFWTKADAVTFFNDLAISPIK